MVILQKIKNKKLLIIIVIVLLIFIINNSNKKEYKKGAGTMNRVVSSTNVAPSSTFTVKYTLTGAIAPYFYIIRDTISSGGCTFSGTVDPKVLPTTLNNPATNTVDFTVNAPSSTGTCVLSGFYKLGDTPSINFVPDATITVLSGCTPESNSAFCSRLGKTCGDVTANDNCGTSRTVNCGTCSTGYTCSNGNCISTSSATMNRVVSSTNVAPSSTFTVKYTLTGAIAPYFYIIRDAISSGGCTFSGTVDPKVLPTTLNNPATNTVDFTVNAPSSTGTCILSGFYKLGDTPSINFVPDATINIGTSTCSGTCYVGACSDYTSCTSATGTCTSGQSCCSGTCTPITPTYTCTQLGGSCYSQSCDALNMTLVPGSGSDCEYGANTCCKPRSTGRGVSAGFGSYIGIFFGLIALVVVSKLLKN